MQVSVTEEKVKKQFGYKYLDMGVERFTLKFGTCRLWFTFSLCAWENVQVAEKSHYFSLYCFFSTKNWMAKCERVKSPSVKHLMSYGVLNNKVKY